MLTLFTEPSLDIAFTTGRIVKNKIKRILKKPVGPYSGHHGVVRSVHEGLKELNIEFNYNPRSIGKVGEHVHVLANVEALKMAIRLKKRGKIKRLTAGPNIVISSADEGGVIGSKEIDLFTANSPWVCDFYVRDNNLLKGRIDYWYAGVDENFWNIGKEIKATPSPRFLFYVKRPEETLLNECRAVLDQYGYYHESIIYGHYKIDELKKRLTSCDFVVFFVEQESQGIALFEIWASNTPVLVWNPGYWQYQLRNFRSSSAPYLTEQTGAFFRDKTEFEKLILQGQTDLAGYAPRDWILKHGTDKESMKKFIEVIGYRQS